jgi:hypothetical protein
MARNMGKAKKPEMFSDPEPLAEDDPEVKLEQFETYKYMGWKPEDLKDEEVSKEYQAWLKTGRLGRTW